MRLTAHELAREAAATGFQTEPLEKAILLLERLNGKGELLPEALTDDDRLRDIIRTHPGLRWKALNVHAYRGTATHGASPESDLV